MNPSNKRATPKIIPKPKIGKDKFKAEIKALENIQLTNLRDVAYYKAPGEKSYNITGDRLSPFTVVNNKKFDLIFQDIGRKRALKGKTNDVKEKGSLFYFKLYNPSIKPKYNKGNAIPDLGLFIDSIFKYPRTKHGYEVIAVVNPEKKVLGYTTIKINHVFMKNMVTEINKAIFENKSLLKKRIDMARYLVNKASTMEGNVKNKETVFNVLKILEKLGFEIYFTPEKGYKLDKDFNYVLEGK